MYAMHRRTEMKTIEIYLQSERYNPVCRATISGAWVAVTKHGDVPICRDYEAKSVDEARSIWEKNNE